MGLIGPSASSIQPSDQNLRPQGTEVNETIRMDPRNAYSANAENYDKLANVRDVFTTQTAVNPDRYPETYNMLLGYPKGYQMVVPYYHRQDPGLDTRSFIVDISMDEHVIHGDFTKINNFEMKLLDNLSVTNQEEDKSVELTGTAVTYPGFEPFEGDLFFLEIDNRQPTIMIVTKVEPTTYRQERFYQIQFSAYTQLTKSLYERIEAAVTERCFFDRKKYFGESQLTFLSSESWSVLNDLKHYRKCIAQDLVNFFYDRDCDTFFRPDGVYDPYVVEMLREKLTVKDDRVHPLQLLVPVPDYHRTIWYKLALAENVTDLRDVWRYSDIVYKTPEIFTSDFNSLNGRLYLRIREKGPEKNIYPPMRKLSRGSVTDTIHGHYPYRRRFPDRVMGYSVVHPDCEICNTADKEHPASVLFTHEFYSGYIDSGSCELTILLNSFLTRTKEIDPKRTVDLVKTYRLLGQDTNAFYRMTLYLVLIDGALTTVR